MSWFRASRKVQDPDGAEWDIYVIRPPDPGASGPFQRMRTRFGLTRRIEAICDFPRPRTLVWEVEGHPGKLLLDEIARGVARGSVPHPAGARFLGEKRY